jgi:ribosomal protein S18 acetylase RimI-like enzyme
MFGVFGPLFILPKGKQHGSFSISLFTQLYGLNYQPVGAAWYRLFKENQKGYGYVDDNTPELGIAVIDAKRGKGIGTLLMKKLFEQALKDGYTSVSLSVDPNNMKAVQLYKKLGFKQYGSSGTSWTMVYNIK